MIFSLPFLSPLLISTIILALLLIGGIVFWFLRRSRRKMLLRDLDTQLLAVRLPLRNDDPNETKNKDPLLEIGHTGQLLSLLAREDVPLVLEVAVAHIGEEIIFYLAVPRKNVEFASRQVQGLWKDSIVEVAGDDYSVFHPQGATAYASVALKQHYAIPIRTYAEAQIDTFGPILSNFSKVNAVGEGLALQIIVRPASTGFKKTISGFIYRLKKGEKLADFFKSELKKIFSLAKKEKPDEPKQIIVDEESVKALEQKVLKPLFLVNVRLVASAPTPYRATELLESLAGSFSQFSAPARNEFKIVKSTRPEKAVFPFIFREFLKDEQMCLNADEIASFFHLPLPGTIIPKIKIARSREAPPPLNMPTSGTLMGESIYRGERKPVLIADVDRRRHLYVIGQTGTGKSRLLGNMAVEDIIAGKGVAVIDPHGELIEMILGLIPKSRYQDVIHFNPGDLEYPLGLNLFEYDFNKPEQKTFIINEILGIFDKLYDLKTTGGPIFEQFLRNAVSLLLEDAVNEPTTLMEVPRIFTDTDYRMRKIARIKNPVTIDFWTKEANKVSSSSDISISNVTPYITSKFTSFMSNDYMRPIIGQTQSAFNFRNCMDEGKILLVNLAKGRIGESNANLIGMIVVGKLLIAALSRVDILDESKRRDFGLFIDEFQNVTTDSISQILSEARKYALNLNIAHQFIAQVEEKIRDAVFGNVGSMAIFRVGPTDAEFLEKQFLPMFNKTDLMNLDNMHACMRLLINGRTAPPFVMKTMLSRTGDVAIRENLKELSRRVYGVSRASVEEDISRRLRD